MERDYVVNPMCYMRIHVTSGNNTKFFSHFKMYDIFKRVFCAVYRLFGGTVLPPSEPEAKLLDPRETIIDAPDEASLTKIIYYYKDKPKNS